jgi:hypothetical protein
MRYFLFILLTAFFISGIEAQNYFTGTLLHSGNRQGLTGANIINLTSLDGTTSDEKGMFSIPAKVNDSIIITFMGFKTVNIKVTDDNLKKHQTIYMVEAPLILDEVIISSGQLTGDLKIDINLIPVQKPVDISPKIAALFGSPKPTALSRVNDVLKQIMNPVDLIYNIFSTRAKDLRRLKKIQKENKVREILARKFDREILSRLLKIDKKDVYLVLEMCDYSEKFITQANDLQILEAILNCYSHYDRYFDKEKKH